MNNELKEISFKIIALLGKPGTGKTTAIQNKIANNPSYCYLTASTGQAAYNLAANISKSLNTPTTIHSALGFKDANSLIYKIQNNSIYNHYRSISENTNVLLIDELSLLNSKLFTALCESLNIYNSIDSNKRLNLFVVGDFGQLPCIDGNPIFYSPYWKFAKINKLTQVRRQTDLEFINVLDLLRNNRASEPECVNWVDDNIGFNNSIDCNFNGITIFTENKEVDNYNLTKLNELPHEAKCYKAIVKGTPPNLKKYIPDELYLKEGSLVTIQVNNFNKGYVNGSIGVVSRLHKDKVDVILKRNGKKVTLSYHTYENINTEQKSKGSISQIPIRLAWASTLHKIQGATLDSIQIKLAKNSRDFLPRLHAGLATALSRCRTPQEIRLIGNKEEFVLSNFIDPRFKAYM